MEHTLDHPLGRLSNGELRKYLAVEALVCRPLLLVLEEPMQGLDRQSRRELARLLRAVVRIGVTLVIVTSRERDVPDLVEHILRVSGAEIVSQDSRTETRSLESTGAQRFPAGLLLKGSAATADVRNPGRRLTVDLRRVTVRQGGAAVLDRVSWRIREGEAWALTGPIGSGKTTLLSIIIGDHPQVYANDVWVFGHRRGNGQTL
jgi:molybdate transport system ATP-binding protein